MALRLALALSLRPMRAQLAGVGVASIAASLFFWSNSSTAANRRPELEAGKSERVLFVNLRFGSILMNMPPKKSIITPEMELRMISEIQIRPVLWDVTVEVYKRQDLKQGAWDEVANNLGVPDLSGALAGRWKNIRETFTANMKRIRESKRSGCGTDDIYVPKWPHFKYLEFLKKTCTQAISESNIPDSVEIVTGTPQVLETGSTSSSTSELYYDENTKKFHPPDNRHSSSESLEFMLSDLSSPLSCNILSPSSLVTPQRPASAPSASMSSASTSKASEPLFERKGSGKKRNYTLMEEAFKLMKEVANQPPPVVMPPPSVETTKLDAFDQFATYIASRLRSMDPSSAKECENKILSILISYN